MKRYTLVDTTYIYSYEDYVDNCEANEVQPQGEKSNDYWDFVLNCQKIEWDDFLLNLGHSKINTEYYWIISGSFGLWFGTRDIELVKCDTLEEAIRKCIGSCDDVIIEKQGNVVYVTGLHHDGRNHFEIRALSKLGNDRFNHFNKWYHKSEIPSILYESIEDYRNGKPITDEYGSTGNCYNSGFINKLFKHHTHCNCGGYTYTWKWDGCKAIRHIVNMNKVQWSWDAEGFHCELNDMPDCYRTGEECIKNNEVMVVKF